MGWLGDGREEARFLMLFQAGANDMTRKAGNKTIDAMVRRIVDHFEPEQIILFGSHARGAAGPDSDVDLLVVMPIEGSKRAKQIEIRVALHNQRCWSGGAYVFPKTHSIGE